MKSRLPFKDFIHSKSPFPKAGFLFCESERVRVVDADTSGWSPEEILEFENHKTLLSGVKIGEPLVGELWLKYLALMVEETLENLNKIGEEFRDYKKSDDYAQGSEKDSFFLSVDDWGEKLRDAIGSGTAALMLKILVEGPKAFKVTSEGCLTFTETFTDYSINDQRSLCNPRPAESPTYAIFLAISLIGYWQLHGYSHIYCPIASLLGKMYECGLFSLLPMFNTENLEQLRPLIQECKKAYGIEVPYLYSELFEYLLEGQEADDSSDGALSVSCAIAHKMLDEEWLKATKELPNEEDPEAETSEE